MSAVLSFPAMPAVVVAGRDAIARARADYDFRLRALMCIGFMGGNVMIPHVTRSANGFMRVEREPMPIVTVELLAHEVPSAILGRAIEVSSCEHVKALGAALSKRAAALEAAGLPPESAAALCDFDDTAAALMLVLRDSLCMLIKALRVSLAERAAATRAEDLAEWECQQ
jgi:hypothetical protein